MNPELEELAKQIYIEYNAGVDLEQFLDRHRAEFVDRARNQGPDVFAVERLHLLRPDLDVVGCAYRMLNPSAKVNHDNPKRTVPAIRGTDGKITVFDPFLPDFIDGVEKRVYGPDEHDQYPIQIHDGPQIIPALFDN